MENNGARYQFFAASLAERYLNCHDRGNRFEIISWKRARTKDQDALLRGTTKENSREFLFAKPR